MSSVSNSEKTSGDWGDLRQPSSRRALDWIVEKAVFLVASSTFVFVLLIFLFLARESLPIILGRETTVLPATASITAETLSDTSDAELQAYLGLSPTEFAELDRATLALLVEMRNRQIAAAPADKDASVNTVSWRYLLRPHQWTGYDRPEYIWQPTSEVAKFNIVPLVVGSIKVTLVALLLAVPLAVAGAIYLSQLAAPRTREWLKPIIELIAGIPSVVLGFFALTLLATVFQAIFQNDSRLNALVAGAALAIAVIPIIFTIAEDALTSVPRDHTQAALALGATKWQAAWKVVLPAALPGVSAAVILGFGRAIGETMIVLIASGNASVMSWDIFESVRTVTATIAAELRETVQGGVHYRVLFLLGIVLFALTFCCNLVADLVIHRFRSGPGGRA